VGRAVSAFSNLLNNPLSWEVELTTRCNSRCVGCSRYSEYYYPNPYFNPKVDLNTELLFKALKETPQISFILFCGNYGDPLLHPEFIPMMERLRQEYGNLRVMVHSNASFGNEDFWKSLAKVFSPPGSYVKFSMDGLGASHEKFRRGTNWEKVMANAESFMAHGGRAVWKMIEFEHNRHEFEEAQKMSIEKGFRKFDPRKNNYPGLDGPILQEVDLKAVPASVTDDRRSVQQLEQWNVSQVKEKKFDTVECKSLSRGTLFIDAHGNLWPCCWVGGLPYRPEHELRQWFQEKTLKNYEKDFNSLAKYNVKEILKHSWMKSDLETSWSNQAQDLKNPLPSTCAKTCGKCHQ
jgi:MoaA/NifB/PqqE/SkfB family radical SAM enzyme